MKRIFTSVALGLSLLVASGGVGFSQSFQKGETAYEKRDYRTAFKEWLPLAEKGNVTAQWFIGSLYENGRGVTQNYPLALKWYQIAAQNDQALAQQSNGQAMAQQSLGFMYQSGSGVIQDKVYAHMWFNIAASNGAHLAIQARDITASMMTPTDISRAQRLARACVAKHYKGC